MEKIDILIQTVKNLLSTADEIGKKITAISLFEINIDQANYIKDNYPEFEPTIDSGNNYKVLHLKQSDCNVCSFFIEQDETVRYK